MRSPYKVLILVFLALLSTIPAVATIFVLPRPQKAVLGVPIRLTSGNWSEISPALSPLGDYVAFCSDREDQSGLFSIWMMSTKSAQIGRKETVLLRGPDVNASTLAWSYMGQLLAFRNTIGGMEQLKVLNLSSGSVTTVLSNVFFEHFEWARNHYWLVFDSFDGESWRISLYDALQGNLSFLPVNNAGKHPTWSMDDKIIFYSAILTPSVSIIRRYTVAEGRDEAFVAMGGQNLWPAVSPDNQYLAWASNSTGEWQIWRAYTNGSDSVDLFWMIPVQYLAGGSTPFADGDSLPVWSPDSASIAFSVDGAKTSSLFVISNTFFAVSGMLHAVYSGPPGAAGAGPLTSTTKVIIQSRPSALCWVDINRMLLEMNGAIYIVSLSRESGNPYQG